MKQLTIGDVHGITEWMIPTFGTEERFYKWLHNKNDDKDYPFNKYDKIIFIGDYCDCFSIENWINIGLTKEEANKRYKSNVEILHNLKMIIEFKKAYPNKVILLIGNHDMHYIKSTATSMYKCSGFRMDAYMLLHELFYENSTLFQIAYQYENYLWTHAGVTRGFLNNFVLPMQNKEYKFSEHTKNMNIAELLNFMYEINNYDLYNVGYSSHGSSPYPGPLWARPSDLNPDPIDLNQIVGHTSYSDIRIFETSTSLDEIKREHLQVNTPVKHIYTDCLSHKKWFILDL